MTIFSRAAAFEPGPVALARRARGLMMGLTERWDPTVLPHKCADGGLEFVPGFAYRKFANFHTLVVV